MVSLCSRRRLTVGYRDERDVRTGTYVGARRHTDVTIVSTDEIDMREKVPTDALDLFEYGRCLAPWHAFVNICGDNRRISAKKTSGTRQTRSD